MAAPCALISSCSEKDPLDLVRQILGTQDLPESTCELEDIESYPWKVETKYYTADIRVCCARSRTIGDEKFADSVHAFVVHFDSNDAESLSKVKMWLPFLKEIMPEVQLLVCDRCDASKGLSKEETWAWCLDNNFELVELNPEVSEGDEDDDFAETLGMQRIIQALHAHTWPNLVMKDESTFRSPYMNKMMHDEAKLKQENNKNAEITVTSSSSNESAIDTPAAAAAIVIEKSSASNSESKIDIDSASAATNTASLKTTSPPQSVPKTPPPSPNMARTTPAESNVAEPNPDELDFASLALGAGAERGGGQGEMSFEELFASLADMKQKAMNLPLEERKKYAEKVAIGFWKAVNGDDDEIDGLSDLDD